VAAAIAKQHLDDTVNFRFKFGGEKLMHMRRRYLCAHALFGIAARSSLYNRIVLACC